MKKIQLYWRQKAGFKDLLTVAIPVIISTVAWTIQHFVDRMFLTWYSAEAIAAAMPAGMLHFNSICLFMGIAGYVNVFIAQYHGAGEEEKFGRIIWQGVYVAIFSSGLIALTYPFADEIFRFIGHDEKIIQNEIIYFRIMVLATFPMIFTSAASGFYSGQGKTRIIMIINVIATGVNILLDYLLIFGNFGFPEMGIRGAALATLIAYGFAMVVYAACLYRPANNQRYKTLADFKFDGLLFKQLLKYGFPNGIQFFLDIAGFSVFILIAGRLGKSELVASNIALNINNLVFMPLLGISMSVSILVGQFLGNDDPEYAEQISVRGIQLAYLWISPFIVIFFFFPDFLISLFNVSRNGQEFESVYRMLVIILRFTAVYSLFDVINLVLAGCLKGAGDTSYTMKIIALTSLTIMVIPTYICLNIYNLSIYFGWSFITVYIVILGIAFFLRFRSGRWKDKRVIYRKNRFIPDFPEIPTPEL